jgi:hypothetical protein
VASGSHNLGMAGSQEQEAHQAISRSSVRPPSLEIDSPSVLSTESWPWCMAMGPRIGRVEIWFLIW